MADIAILSKLIPLFWTLGLLGFVATFVHVIPRLRDLLYDSCPGTTFTSLVIKYCVMAHNRPKRSFGQGNIFTPVCHSFCSQGGGSEIFGGCLKFSVGV